MQQLSDLTGCDVGLSTDDFILCVESAGGDLFDCQIELDADAFDACVVSQYSAGSIIAAKYRQIKDADLSLHRARLQFENIGKQIQYENERVQYQIEVWKDFTGAQKEHLDKYQEKLTGSYLVKETKTKTKVKDRDSGEVKEKDRLKTTVKTFTLRDDEMEIETEKAKDMLDITLDFQIKMASDDTAVKNLLLQQADALIGIDVAVNNKNAMIAAFDSAMNQKESLLALWRNNLDFYEKYYVQKLPYHRIIQSQNILNLTAEFNELAHYAHLATKALEYKFMEVLENVDLPGGTLNSSDLFKCQTSYDFENYLSRLQQYNVLECPAGEFQQHYYRLSLAYDILGLTDENLGDANGDGYVDSDNRSVVEVRFEKFQEFINENIDSQGDLSFSFTDSVYDAVFMAYQKANLKIWHGGIPCGADTSKGLTASLFFRGSSGAIFPVVYVAQKGSHTFRRKDLEIAEYYPVKTRAMQNHYDTASEPFTKDFFTPFKGIDPRFDTEPMGEWTPAFTNRSVAATLWDVTLYQEPAEYGFDDIPFYKLRDICFYFGTIGNNFN